VTYPQFLIEGRRFANVAARLQQTATIATLLAALVGTARSAELAACADRYGRLMVDHWMTVNTLQQLERFLYYDGELTKQPQLAVRYRQQADAVGKTGGRLKRAYQVYATLFKSPSKEGIEKLNEELEKIAAASRENDEQVSKLLSEAGKSTAGDSFQATPVSKEQIKPGWDASQVDEKQRPKRILFGSTGAAGDNRILPLGFDFGSGLYSFYVPMAARDKLEVTKPADGWTDAVRKWMRDQKMGYHYWAGVYNNNNTYVADWFVKQFGKDDDVWMKTIDGKVRRSAAGGFGQPNVWNPSVRDYMRNYCETQARYFHDDPSLVCYDYTGEPHPYAMNPGPHDPQYSGYNDSAVAAFREFLKRKFTTIDALNRAWKSSYSGFDAIRPPADPYATPMEKATPISYEFELFRCDSQTSYWKLVYDAYRKYDAKKPIEAHASMYMSGWPAQAMDAYQMLKAGVADWIDMHQNNFPPNLPEQIYLYSICRLTGRVPVQFEYIWTYPRTGAFDPSRESDFRATCQSSVWRNLVWGKQAFVFFDFYYEWPGYRNGMFDKDLGYSILRSSACVIPTVKRQALRFNDVLLNTEIEEPPIVVLQPSASVWNSPPIHPHDGFSFHTNAGMRVHELLFPHNYPFLYVPEEAILEDGYKLSKHRAIILPQGPYLPPKMTDALLDWIRGGGTLIATGVPGIWTPYGEEDMRLVNQVFGKSQVTDLDHGRWRWKWQLLERRPEVEFATNDASGTVSLARARYGKGTVLVATNGYDSADARKQFYKALDGAIGKRPASCSHDAFELTIRTGKKGRYLCVLNPDTREVREDDVAVQGRYAGSKDLGIGSGVRLPLQAKDGETRFKLRLHPGESTIIELKP
jgi:hypothetical protein